MNATGDRIMRIIITICLNTSTDMAIRTARPALTKYDSMMPIDATAAPIPNTNPANPPIMPAALSAKLIWLFWRTSWKGACMRSHAKTQIIGESDSEVHKSP